MLLLALDGIEEGGVEEREQTANQPTPFVSILIVALLVLAP